MNIISCMYAIHQYTCIYTSLHSYCKLFMEEGFDHFLGKGRLRSFIHLVYYNVTTLREQWYCGTSVKVHILPVFIRWDKLSDDDLNAAIIYYHIDGVMYCEEKWLLPSSKARYDRPPIISTIVPTSCFHLFQHFLSPLNRIQRHSWEYVAKQWPCRQRIIY